MPASAAGMAAERTTLMSAPGEMVSSERPTDTALLLKQALDFIRTGRWADAEAACRRVLQVEPQNFDSLHLLGIMNLQRGRAAEAVLQFDAALKIDGKVADAQNNRGNALKELKRYDEALASYDRAVALRPDFAEAFINRGNALVELKRREEALASYDRGVALRPYAAAFYSRGIVLSQLKRRDEAIASFDQAIALDPGHAEAFNARANTLVELKRIDEAMASFEKSIALKPARAEAYYDRALGRLLAGQYPGGWADHEWRWESKGFPNKRPKVDAPPWQGQDLSGQRLLVCREQGLGDIIQFSRYLPLLRQAGADVSFYVGRQLNRLLRPVTAGIDVINELKPAASFDFQCALMSLPHRFKTDLQSIPAPSCLRAEPDLVARWRERIGEHGFKVGIAWHGNPKALELTRFTPLAEFIPLARIPGVRLISLQHKDGLDQLAELPADVRIETLGDDFDSGPDLFIDAAAVMANLDLIISCDTSIPHLAGSLGRPTWIAIKHIPDYRWMLERDDSPWYPTVRLFRQPDHGDWKPVFADMERQLRALLRSPAPSRAAGLRAQARRLPSIQVSWGELFDRIASLETRMARQDTAEPIAAARRELAALLATAAEVEAECPDVAALGKELRALHETLWETGKAMRAKQASASFGQGFIDLARSVSLHNDRLTQLKRTIDRLLDPQPVVQELQ